MQHEGIETELIQVGGQLLHGCITCQCFARKDLRCSVSDDCANTFIEKMLQSYVIITASPTYFAALTPETKALINRCGLVSRANGDVFKRKAGAAVVAVRRSGAINGL